MGGGAEADLQFDDPGLSPRHCRLEATPKGVKITDLGSGSGTWVNGREISQVLLKCGDVAVAGEVELRVVGVPAGSPAVSAAAGRSPLPAAPATRPPDSRRPESAGTGGGRPEANGERPDPIPELASSRAPRGGGRRSAPASYLPTIGLGMAALALAVFVFFPGGGDEDAAAALSREAQAFEAEGNLPRALAILERLRSRYPESEAASRSQALATSLTGRIQQQREAATAFGAVLSNPEMTTFEIVRVELEAVGARFAPGVTPADVEAQVAHARSLFEDRADGFVRGVRTRALALIEGRAYGAALDVLADAEASGRLFGRSRDVLAATRMGIEDQARQVFGDVLREIGGLPQREALTKLKTVSVQLAGTAHEGQVRARISLMEAALQRGEPAPAAVAATSKAQPGAGPERAEPELLSVLAEAEGLISERRFAAAVPALERVLERVTGAQAQELGRRLERVRAMADVIDRVVERVDKRPGAFREMKVGTTLRGRVVSASREKVTLSLGPGARVTWTWRRLRSDQFESLVVRSGLEGPPSVEAAAIMLQMGDSAGALRLLARRFEAEPGLRDRVNELTASARGVLTPEDGFHLYRGDLLTREELDEAVLVARMTELVSRVTDAPAGQWAGPAQELAGLGPRGERRLMTALSSRLEGLKNRVDALPAFQPRRLGALRRQLMTELDKRRGAALRLIFDKTRYPYPDAPNQAEVQAEVDALVDQVREIWATPSRYVMGREEGLEALVADGVEVAQALEARGGEVPEAARVLDIMDKRIAMDSYDPGNGVTAHWRSVREHNDRLLEDETLTAPERDCYTATNNYRVMMGLRAVMAAPALVKAARDHSQEMKDKGYFAHRSPTPGRETPGQRAQLAGWGGSVSENIARGRPDGFAVVAQWCQSSGHHRNILGKRWTHLGAGKARDGAFWTQNFGVGRANPPQRRGK